MSANECIPELKQSDNGLRSALRQAASRQIQTLNFGHRREASRLKLLRRLYADTWKVSRLTVVALLLAAVFGSPTQARHSTYTGSAKVRRDFKQLYPCPFGETDTGACPGWVIDYIVPLACGGEDDTSNMDWQTVENAKAKDKVERKKCKARPHGAIAQWTR